MRQEKITMPRLLNLSFDPIATWFRRKWITAKLNKEYMHLDYFKAQAKEANRGAAEVTKRIVNLETALRDMR